MTQREYEQNRHDAWIAFKTESMFTIDEEAFCAAFDRAYALDKQEKDAENTVIQGWMGRDQDGYISLFQERPTRDTCDKGDIPYGFWDEANGHHLELPITSFPDLTWESDPLEVEIIIKRKKNG